MRKCQSQGYPKAHHITYVFSPFSCDCPSTTTVPPPPHSHLTSMSFPCPAYILFSPWMQLNLYFTRHFQEKPCNLRYFVYYTFFKESYTRVSLYSIFWLFDSLLHTSVFYGFFSVEERIKPSKSFQFEESKEKCVHNVCMYMFFLSRIHNSGSQLNIHFFPEQLSIHDKKSYPLLPFTSHP